MNEAEYLKRSYGNRGGCYPILTSIDVEFIFDSARLGLFSSSNILQIADVAFRVVFLMLLPCFYLYFTQFLLLERVKCPPTNPTQLRPQAISVNGALTCKEAALLTSSVD